MPKAKKKAMPKKAPQSKTVQSKPMPKMAVAPKLASVARKPVAAKPSLGLAVVGLILNILFMPGLGSVIAGKTKTGLWQLLLLIIGLVLALTFVWLGMIIGVAMMAVAWSWGLFTGVKAIMEVS